MSNTNELISLLKEPSHIFMAIKDQESMNKKTDLLAFILEQGANHAEHLNMIKNMAQEKEIPMSTEVVVIYITRTDLDKSEVEKMARDIIDAIHEGEEEDYDPVSITLGDIIG